MPHFKKFFTQWFLKSLGEKQRNSFVMFYIVFHSGFLSTCETKLTITFEPNMQFEWGKIYFILEYRKFSFFFKW